MKARAKQLPTAIRQTLINARRRRGWSQAELGQRVGLPQMHISGIETGKVVPRFDTLLDLVRVLGHDLVLVPRELVPIVQSLTRDHRNRRTQGPDEEPDYEDAGPLYTPDEDERPS